MCFGVQYGSQIWAPIDGHQAGTAKMGRDSMSVVDGALRVYGVEGLRIADGSVMPRITIGNTTARCVIIGEPAGQFLRSEHKLQMILPAP
jgi:choline dehydrogenase